MVNRGLWRRSVVTELSDEVTVIETDVALKKLYMSLDSCTDGMIEEFLTEIKLMRYDAIALTTAGADTSKAWDCNNERHECIVP